jgi:hypothetical protein
VESPEQRFGALASAPSDADEAPSRKPSESDEVDDEGGMDDV